MANNCNAVVFGIVMTLSGSCLVSGSQTPKLFTVGQWGTDSKMYSLDNRMESKISDTGKNSIAIFGTDTEIMKLDNLSKIKDFSFYEDDWNGYGAKKFDPNFLETIKKYISKSSLQPEIFPLPDGSLQFEYSLNGKYTEIVVSREKIQVYQENESGSRTEEYKADFDLNEVIGKWA